MGMIPGNTKQTQAGLLWNRCFLKEEWKELGFSEYVNVDPTVYMYMPNACEDSFEQQYPLRLCMYPLPPHVPI